MKRRKATLEYDYVRACACVVTRVGAPVPRTGREKCVRHRATALCEGMCFYGVRVCGLSRIRVCALPVQTLWYTQREVNLFYYYYSCTRRR